MYKEVEFLKFIIENLVDHKDDINIDRQEDELGVLLILRVNSDDMWFVIGKQWKIVNAIRTLLRVVWSRESKRINLKILD